ncbi:hypothetical protein IEU95_01485 [Hoyosella rhizosphaerae]|nr:hypothetical protein [Hoyosella rhizosphaerae]MBN4925486.1 hypothetical protein [Hoyosella rhizosphaerae]
MTRISETYVGDGYSPAETSGASKPSRIPVVLVAILAVVSAVLGFLYWDASRGQQQLLAIEELRAEALDDASRYAELFGTYDFENLDENLNGVKAISTPEYAEEYESIVEELSEVILAAEARSVGTVANAGVQELTDEVAVVVVFLNQQVTNLLIEDPAGRRDPSRIVITLQRDGDQWLLRDAQPA